MFITAKMAIEPTITKKEPSQFTSACLPQYAPLVEELRISGELIAIAASQSVQFYYLRFYRLPIPTSTSVEYVFDDVAECHSNFSSSARRVFHAQDIPRGHIHAGVGSSKRYANIERFRDQLFVYGCAKGAPHNADSWPDKVGVA